MGSSEMEKSDKEKEPKTPPPPSASSASASAPATSQEPSSAVSAGMATPDWSGFQAYSPMPPHGYVASSPQPHPYMWGHMMPPYGTPPHPYVTMYPPGGMYTHPSLPPGSYPYSPYAMPSPNGVAEATGNTGSGIEGDAAKQPEVKEKLPIKRSKGSLGSLNMIIGKNNETGKSSANGACSKSAESASDGSSDGSDANSQNDSGSRHNGKDDETATDSAHGPPVNGSNLPVNQIVPIMSVPATGVPGPPTNLNIGMDYWSGHGNVSTTVPGVVVDGSQSQPWLQPQDERELKRQRRKQSNRESARRSRLRKQAECDELAQRADVLNGENTGLRAEISKLKSQYEELLAENSSLKNRYSSVEGVNLEKNAQEPETSTLGDVAETTHRSYNNSA
ncbi:unnamed protein product [Microthlaspi erraticum]|uniref:BZIP domain-containing protein n=1 Tax=Microthlaspi erraticum TaxID=1685480 RepID=A0A6D2II51_9BRAS|nr:unnamed protein product [Microthlaspi erraticum]